MLAPYLIIAVSPKGGKGVFTTRSIKKGTIIEVAPVIVLSVKDRKIADTTKLYNYVFEWGKSKRQACVGLGYISMYNHSFEPNCEYEQDYETELMMVKTLRDIKKGEELFFSYNGDPENKRGLWFKTV